MTNGRSLRLIFNAYLGMMGVLLVASWFLVSDADDREGSTGWFIWVLAAHAVMGLAWILILRRRGLSESPDAAADPYRANVLARLSLAESIFMMGFVGIFIVGKIWPIFVALPPALAGMALSAPGRGEIG